MNPKRQIDRLSDKDFKAIEDVLYFDVKYNTQSCPFIDLQRNKHCNKCIYIFPAIRLWITDFSCSIRDQACPCFHYSKKYIRKVIRKILKDYENKKQSS